MKSISKNKKQFWPKIFDQKSNFPLNCYFGHWKVYFWTKITLLTLTVQVQLTLLTRSGCSSLGESVVVSESASNSSFVNCSSTSLFFLNMKNWRTSSGWDAMNLIEKKKSLRKLYYPVSQKVFDRNLVKISGTEKNRESDNLTNFLTIIYLSRFAIFLAKTCWDTLYFYQICKSYCFKCCLSEDLTDSTGSNARGSSTSSSSLISVS